MGLIKQLKRLRYVYGWRLKFWYLDTEEGRRTQFVIFGLSLFFSAVFVVRSSLMVYDDVTSDQPLQAYVATWIWYVIEILISVAISYATRPRPQNAKPVEQQDPSIEDGRSVIYAFGEVWIDSTEFSQLAHRNLQPTPIKTKGGKK